MVKMSLFETGDFEFKSSCKYEWNLLILTNLSLILKKKMGIEIDIIFLIISLEWGWNGDEYEKIWFMSTFYP